jgi:hypothetical protein
VIVIIETETRPTLSSDRRSPRVCMSVHPEGRLCSDVGSSDSHALMSVRVIVML